ncbi:hypothetical protein [Vibrio sp. 10N]|uniref:hypothetical protein n=1 Tax=Vibrio sp. 10N TaxID=3058938 RepID=UPI0028140F10|nr:hypothetical protein VB10N_28870 [Vibrio sp. 10N]
MKQVIFYGIENKSHLDALDSFLQSQKHIAHQGIINETSDSRASSGWNTVIYTGELEELERREGCLYICFYSAPELAVSHDTSQQDWYQRHEQRLSWAMERLETTILVEEYRTFQNLTALCALLSDQYDVALSLPQLPSLKVSISELASQMGALALLQAEPKSQTLFEQLESAAELLGEDFNPSIAHRLATYQKKISEHEREAKLAHETEQANLAKITSQFKEKTTQLETANLELRSENELAFLQIHQLQEELEQAHLSATQTEQALKDELANTTIESDKTNAQLVTKNLELASENELALLQIHQLQEELEQAHLSATRAEQALKDELANTTIESDKTNAQLVTKNLELASENELALLQIHQLQEELEQAHLSATRTEQALNDELANVTIESDKKNAQLVTTNLELASENELALLQIHQLQEELEQAHLSATRTEQELKDELANVTIESDNTNAQLVTTNLDLASENELAMLQIHQLQEELEQTYLAAKQSEQSLESEQTKSQELASHNEIAAKQVLKLQSEIDQLQKSMDSKENMLDLNKQHLMDKLSEEQSKVELLNNKLAQQTTITTELQAENELALLQIHQLQEELEHYYLKYQQQASWTPLEACVSNDSSHLRTTLQLLS